MADLLGVWEFVERVQVGAEIDAWDIARALDIRPAEAIVALHKLAREEDLVDCRWDRNGNGSFHRKEP